MSETLAQQDSPPGAVALLILSAVGAFLALIATHYAFGYSPQKHYIVSVNVVCPVHGPEVWTIEKLLTPNNHLLTKKL